MSDEEDLFSKTVPCAWEAGGERVLFAATNIVETGGNRLAGRERVYRRGARQDSTGARADSWTLMIPFYNGMREPGIPANPYPAEINRLIDACKIQETGTLTLSTRGPKRARADHWTRTEVCERRDYATLDITFVEDNEDDQTAASFSAPNARSAAVATATAAVAALVEEGVWSPDVASLEQLAGELEALALAPSDFIDDLQEKAVAMQNTVARIEAAFLAPASKISSGTLVPGAEQGTLLSLPTSWRALFLLRTLAELAATAVSLVPGRSRPVPKRYGVVVSIFDVAIDVGQDLEDLMSLNSHLPDMRAIPAGREILIRPARS